MRDATCEGKQLSEFSKGYKSHVTKMKVGVIGAGVGGLAMARNLQYFRNCGVASVKVYEKSPVLKPALGGALGLQGGTVCLAKAGLGSDGNISV